MRMKTYIIIVLICMAIIILYPKTSKRRIKYELNSLIKKNNITDLPPEFNLWSEDTMVKSYYFKDINENKYVLINANYNIGPGGTRSCAFIFNKKGYCIIWKPDDYSLDAGLCDLTGDGNYEKTFNYIFDKENYDVQIFEVYEIFDNQARKLLAVEYNIGSINHPIQYSLQLWPGKNGRYQLQLIQDINSKNNVIFIWSTKENKFIAKGPRNNEWKIIYPD